MSFALLLDFTGYIGYLLFVLLGSAVGIGYIVRYTLVFSSVANILSKLLANGFRR